MRLKSIIIEIAKYIILFFGMIVIYLGALYITSLIPSSILEKNVTTSSEILIKEGETKEVELVYKKEYVFTFTDALMINTAYSIDSHNPFESMMLARKNYIPGQTLNVYEDSQYNLGASEKYINKNTGGRFQTMELYGLMHGDNITEQQLCLL